MTKVKSNITPDTILKNFWKDNNRFADLFNACFFDGNPELNPDDLTEVDTDISSLLQFHGYADGLNYKHYGLAKITGAMQDPSRPNHS